MFDKCENNDNESKITQELNNAMSLTEFLNLHRKFKNELRKITAAIHLDYIVYRSRLQHQRDL
jgi:hypothetical protein